MNPLTLKRDRKGEFFEMVFADMQKQFPFYEMKSQLAIKQLLERGKYHLLLAYDGNVAVGYLILYADRRSRTLWLDYFAVFGQFHSKGYGSRLLPLLKQCYPAARGCYMEVERPESYALDSIRRTQFYRHCGARRLNLDYLYPCVGGMFPMHLFFLPFDEQAKEGMTPEDVFGTIRRVFRDIHPDIPHIGGVLRIIRRNLRRRANDKREFLRRKNARRV